MKVGDLVRFRPDQRWLNHHDDVGILIKFKASDRWVDVYWPGIDNGLLGVYLVRELEVISEGR